MRFENYNLTIFVRVRRNDIMLHAHSAQHISEDAYVTAHGNI